MVEEIDLDEEFDDQVNFEVGEVDLDPGGEQPPGQLQLGEADGVAEQQDGEQLQTGPGGGHPTPAHTEGTGLF